MSVSTRVRDVLVVIGAPALVGACLGISFGVWPLVRAAVGLPAIFIGVGLLMAPALYIAAGFLGVAPSASDVTRAAAASLKDAGIVMLGLTPALAFLVATTHREGTIMALAHGVVGLTALLTLLILYRRLFARSPAAMSKQDTGPRLKVPALYLCWSAVSLGLGWRLLLSCFAA